MISPYQVSGPGGAVMLHRENSTGAWAFVEELNHELCSPSYHPTVDGGCMIKEYCVAVMRLFGFRRSAPRESIPLIEPEPLTYLPLPMEGCPDQRVSAFVTSDQIFVVRLSTESPLAPQLC